jgi:hypothetical protein
MQRPTNIGALMQDTYDVEQRSLDGRVIRLRRPSRNRGDGAREFVTYSVFQSA